MVMKIGLSALIFSSLMSLFDSNSSLRVFRSPVGYSPSHHWWRLGARPRGSVLSMRLRRRMRRIKHLAAVGLNMLSTAMMWGAMVRGFYGIAEAVVRQRDMSARSVPDIPVLKGLMEELGSENTKRTATLIR